LKLTHSTATDPSNVIKADLPGRAPQETLRFFGVDKMALRGETVSQLVVCKSINWLTEKRASEREWHGAAFDTSQTREHRRMKVEPPLAFDRPKLSINSASSDKDNRKWRPPAIFIVSN
jgi:hypothetical protein